MAIPDDDLRTIKELPVYCTTAVWSLLAYLWLLVILMGGQSTNVVELWEGGLTLLFMPLLVFMAFLADLGYFSKSDTSQGKSRLRDLVGPGMTVEQLAHAEVQIRQELGQHLSESQIAKIMIAQSSEGSSRAQRRVAAIREFTAGKRVENRKWTGSTSNLLMVRRAAADGSQAKLAKVAPAESAADRNLVRTFTDTDGDVGADTEETCVVGFAKLSFAALEGDGTIEATVVRSGWLSKTARVAYSTREGTAKPGEDFEHSSGVLMFSPGVSELTVAVSLIDDNEDEGGSEYFYLDLWGLELLDSEGGLLLDAAELDVATSTMVIVDDDDAGQISFAQEQMSVQESPTGEQTVPIIVRRTKGCSGEVSCNFCTEDDTALAGVDYHRLEGTLTFLSGETSATIECAIMGRGRYASTDRFRVVLSDVEGGARFDPKTDGGEDSCILTVTIESQGQEAKDRIDRILSRLNRKWEKSRIGHANWRDQFLNALYIGGKPDAEEDRNRDSVRECFGADSVVPTFDLTSPTSTGSITPSSPRRSTSSGIYDMYVPSWGDYVMHVLTLPWKLLFALVPPTDYCGGWVCFYCSLIMIAVVTAAIGDFAALLGCVLDIPDEVTAITIVALGTSLPDTFASKTAAVDDPVADASIGNVTGSNSVNVFLGLGVPWTMGAIYWSIMGSDATWRSRFGNDTEIPESFRSGSFVVKAGSLGFSVAVFCCCAVLAMAMLYLRRRYFGGELGGPRLNKRISAGFLVALWVIYVVLSSWSALQQKSSCA
jgi:solute carrier family 8 (sodium/calcium exchanger)